MKRALLSGGTGFVGANLARRLLADGHDVNLLVRRGHDPWRIQDLGRDVRIHEAVLTDIRTVTTVVEAVRPDWVFHLAAYGAYPAQRDARNMVQTNIVGGVNFMEACVRVGFEAFVNTGSSSEYGFKHHAPAEDELLEPNSNYAVTKASATLFCRYAAQEHGVHMPTLRLYSVYGPYEEPTRLIPTLIIEGLQRRLPPLANPNIARDFVYVEDVVEAYVQAAATPGQESGAVYNVGTGMQTTLGEIVELARGSLDITEEPEWGSMLGRSWDTEVWVADNTRIRKELGWEPRYSIEEGFGRFVSWFKGHTEMRPIYERRIG